VRLEGSGSRRVAVIETRIQTPLDVEIRGSALGALVGEAPPGGVARFRGRALSIFTHRVLVRDGHAIALQGSVVGEYTASSEGLSKPLSGVTRYRVELAASETARPD
jgi:hypothetical protein